MKLTKADIDKVRHIEGFPIADDEDIIALSNPPYYTACPNPFIEDFIKEHGTPYNEETDDYHREPFTADIREGKNDPMYMAHGYHTKVPYKAIVRYILNYTKPGDIVLDGFCGTGMTGVATQMCGNPDSDFKFLVEHEMQKSNWGYRKAIISDLSPEASFVANVYNTMVNKSKAIDIANKIITSVEKEYGWMYYTDHASNQNNLLSNSKIASVGFINYVVWSDVFRCPNCYDEKAWWDTCIINDKEHKKAKCQNCGIELDIKNTEKVWSLIYDKKLLREVKQVKQVPCLIKYTYNRKQYKKLADKNDLDILERIGGMDIPNSAPVHEMPIGFNTEQPKKSHNITHTHQFYTKRNLIVLSSVFAKIDAQEDLEIRNFLKFWFSSIYSRSHKMNRYMPNHNRHVGPLSGTLYVPYFQAEINIFNLLRDKLKSVSKLNIRENNVIVSTQSMTAMSNIPNNAIDYVFTDPPFGGNFNYSELNYIWESWLKVFTNNKKEAIINEVQNKQLLDYQNLMTQCFKEYYRVLKPNRWITIEFSNSKNSVWIAIQEALIRAGFIVADIRVLDKVKGTTKQLSYTSTVKQDLIISAYKPKEKLSQQIIQHSGTQETVWDFINEHLDKLPIVVMSDSSIEHIREREAFMLFDRMVSFHVMSGIAVPIEISDFYRKLDEKYLKRDNMYFLHDQINEYDNARIVSEIKPIQFSLYVSDERSAISWLYNLLDEKISGPQTYGDIMPKFVQELRQDKHEDLPELMTMLEENFLQDDGGKWYIPDITKEGDLIKLREKRLLKDFEEYLSGKGKLKTFRTEAVRAGFAKLWKDKNYTDIVRVAERLPETVIQEDDKLLMYYDISLSRME